MPDTPQPRPVERTIDIAAFRPRALIFDLDGTLTDNMPLHAEAFELFTARHGLPPMTMEARKKYDGKRNSEIFPELFGRPLNADELAALEDEKEGIYRERSRGVLQPLKGFLRLVERARAHGLTVAVATSSPKANVEHTLGETGLDWLLPRVARGDEVRRGKPFPDVFLLAAERAGVEPAGCLAFEDAPVGVEAIVAAGMICCAVTTSFDERTFMAARVPPHACVADYAAFLEGPGRWLRERTA